MMMPEIIANRAQMCLTFCRWMDKQSADSLKSAFDIFISKLAYLGKFLKFYDLCFSQCWIL